VEAFAGVNLAMLKSHEEELRRVYACLFQDIANTYPCLREDLTKDLEKLENLLCSRGPSLVMVDMPAVGKHFDRCLSEGQYSVSSLPLTKRCPRSIMYPEFLRGLWGLVFTENGCLKEDCDVEAIIFIRQIYYLAKKAVATCPEEAVSAEVRAFYLTDCELPLPSPGWASEHGLQDDCPDSFLETYQERLPADESQLRVFLRNLDLVSGILSTTLGRYDPSEWRFKHGPGVVSERKGCFNKYEFVNWSNRLERVFPIADFGFHNHTAWASHVQSERNLNGDEPSSRLIAVPKTFDKPRLIAAEPSENMWCQQNLWHYFRSRTESSWIASFVRFNDQSLNQNLARRGSQDGSLATLDLSSASDRVSCQFVGCLFRSNPGMLDALQASRTRYLTQHFRVPGVPSVIELRKFSSMGNACTFPVESLGFLAVALASVATVRQMRVTTKTLQTLSGELAVFGDDIIVPFDTRELVCRALEVLDFKINSAKSFWSGNFRESCGVDAYRGIDVSPVYWRRPTENKPDSIVSAVEVRNSFHLRGYWTVARHLASTVPRAGVPVVSIDSGVFGFLTFSGCRLSGHSFRFNRSLQRQEVRVLRPSSKHKLEEIRDDSVLLQFFTEAPEPHLPWRGGYGQRPVTRLSQAWVDISDFSS
jgi:hypothetical protein